MITYFAKRHLLSNVIFFGIIILGAFAWQNIGKEELPEFASDRIRISTTYPGASVEDVELFVTKMIEDELLGVVGIEEVKSTSSQGSSNITVTIDENYPDKKEAIQDIKDAALRANLPSEVRDLPRFRQFKSSEKAILDIGIYHKKHKSLDNKSRQELQKFVLSFENQLLALDEISSIDKSHYKKPELKILVDPKKILKKELSLSQVKNQIQNNNIRVPIGSLSDVGESKITALNELETPDSLNALMLQGNYEGDGIKLKDIAQIDFGFEKPTSIFKVNGHEAIFLNIKKSVSTDILSAHRAISAFITKFQKLNKDAPIGIILMDDESYAVRNRLNIISSNGLIGFTLIVLILLIFLDFKTGFWVAMGIPFTMSFTLIIAHIIGYTVNNMTLAGIIIVLGIVVDDAIIIAENISRHKEQGKSLLNASIDGTREVFKPILASIITTCVAFVPLIFFEGFFGKLVTYIPLIVILMLLGSLIESLFVRPSHLSTKTPLEKDLEQKEHWFKKFETKYEVFITKILHHRAITLSLSSLIVMGSFYIFNKDMKFAMFPREESKEVFIKIKAFKNATKEETSKLIEPLEMYIAKDTKNVVGLRTSIAQSRRGGTVKSNEASILVEIFPADDRAVKLSDLINDWEKQAEKLEKIESAKFLRGRWGHGSGNAIELQIQENDNKKRDQISSMLSKEMKAISDLVDVEIEDPLQRKEYLFSLKQVDMIRYNVSPTSITTILRSFVEGSILYTINKGDEEVDVRLTVPESEKQDLNNILNLRVENKEGQLIYLKNVVTIKEEIKPINIVRNNYKRATMVYANMAKDTNSTPLEIAQKMEKDIFPKITNLFPTAILKFKGEIEDTRESQGEFQNSIIIVIILIYFILIIMFNSMFKPLLILSIVPFAATGVIIALYLHEMNIYGFFAVIGALGMIGVVINDAIVMIDKIENSHIKESLHPWETIAKVSATRLRPVLLTTITTVAGILPTAYGIAGYDSMLAEMMLTMGWGLLFGTIITLILVPLLYSLTVKEHS